MKRLSATIAALLIFAPTFSAQARAQNPTGQSLQSGRGNVQNNQSNTVACNSLLFTVSSPTDSATGHATGRTSVSAITCVRAVDQVAVGYVEDAMTHKLVNVTLNWGGQITAALSNAEVSSVQFTMMNNAEVAQIAFNFQRMELTHTGSNTKVLIQ